METILHILPVTLALGSFWCHTKHRLLLLNLLLCASMALLFIMQLAWSGAVVMLLAAASSAYVLFTRRTLRPLTTLTTLLITLPFIFWLNLRQQSLSWTEILPVLTFLLYRYGELSCQERGLRVCIVAGALIFIVYAWITQTWGALATELIFVLSNLYYLFRKLPRI